MTAAVTEAGLPPGTGEAGQPYGTEHPRPASAGPAGPPANQP